MMKLTFFLKERFLYLLLFAFIFVSSCALLLSKVKNQKQPFGLEGYTKVFSPLPVLSDKTFFPVISAQAALAVDLTSGVTLYEKNPEKKLLPASTTKIVTALVAMEYYPLDKILTVGNVWVEGQKMNLVKGERISVRDLLYGLLVYSANDAAEVLAANYLGGVDGFVYAMNQKAKDLHLTNTYFTNPVGLDGNQHYSTARDLIIVSKYAMANPLFAQMVATGEKTVFGNEGKIKHHLTNINQLLGKVDGVLGVKTGWTEEARENLVTYLNRNNHQIMIALLGSQDRFGETVELIDWIFANYEWKEVKLSFSNSYLP